MIVKLIRRGGDSDFPVVCLGTLDTSACNFKQVYKLAGAYLTVLTLQTN
jgi:hypothetical protein